MQGARRRIANETAADRTAAHARGLSQEPRGRHEERAETDERHPAPHDDRAQERRGAPRAEEQRQEKAGVAERLECRPPEPHADGPREPLLLGWRQRRIERRERDEAEARGQERRDALDLADPAIAAALLLAARLAFSRLAFRRDDGRHQTS